MKKTKNVPRCIHEKKIIEAGINACKRIRDAALVEGGNKEEINKNYEIVVQSLSKGGRA